MSTARSRTGPAGTGSTGTTTRGSAGKRAGSKTAARPASAVSAPAKNDSCTRAAVPGCECHRHAACLPARAVRHLRLPGFPLEGLQCEPAQLRRPQARVHQGQRDGASTRVGVRVAIDGCKNPLLHGRAQWLHRPFRQAARMSVRQTIALRVAVPPEPGGEARQRPALVVDHVLAQPARRPAQRHVLPGPPLEVLLPAQIALQRESGWRRLAARERGNSREVLTREAKGLRGYAPPRVGGQIGQSGPGPRDSVAAYRPRRPRNHTPHTQPSRGCRAIVDQTLVYRGVHRQNAGSHESRRVELIGRAASIWSGGRDSNPRHPAWKASALPSELPPPTGLDAGRLHPDRATSYPAPDPSTLIVPNRDSGILPLPACAVSVTILAARWVCAFQWSAKPSFQWVGHA